jgi:hypothetical protein
MSEHTLKISNKTSSAAANNIVIQRSLAIGAVNDPLEHEADAVADKVMRMPANNFIQRKCPGCKDEEDKAQRKPLASFIQKMGNDSGTKASDSVSQRINSTKGSGSNLDSGTKSFMESRFGTDFSGVKIHTGDYAVQMSQELNAQAFTVGSDVYFNSGKYNPDSDSGKQLLAHELTHTLQQQGGINKKIQKSCTPAELIALNTTMHSFCDLPRRCNMQTDTCPTAVAKIAAGNGCISLRTLIQQRCFTPGDPGYETHMEQIAQAYAALRNCYTVEAAKCNNSDPVPVPVPVPLPTPAPVPVQTPKSTFELIEEFARNVVDQGLDAEQAAEEFLRQNPGIAMTIVALGVVGIIALVADDLSIAGIVDDVLVPVIATLVRVAWRFAF